VYIKEGDGIRIFVGGKAEVLEKQEINP